MTNSDDDEPFRPQTWHEWLAAPGTIVLNDGRRVQVAPGDKVLVEKDEDGDNVLIAWRPRQPRALH